MKLKIIIAVCLFQAIMFGQNKNFNSEEKFPLIYSNKNISFGNLYIDAKEKALSKESHYKIHLYILGGAYLKNNISEYAPNLDLLIMLNFDSSKASGGFNIELFNKYITIPNLLTLSFRFAYNLFNINNFEIKPTFRLGEFFIYKFPPMSNLAIHGGVMIETDINTWLNVVALIEYQKNFDYGLSVREIGIGLRFNDL